jgi:hypothetical protein
MFKKAKPFIAVSVLGLGITLFGVFLEALLRLAYEHNALGPGPQSIAISALLVIDWPGQFLNSLGVFYGATYFSHSHVQGSDFWFVLLQYVAINSAGWILLLALIVFLLQKVFRRTA